MKNSVLAIALLLASCGDERPPRQGDPCTPASCGDEMFCTTSRLKDGSEVGPMCMPTCASGAECSTHCCLPLIGFDVWTCAVAEACQL